MKRNKITCFTSLSLAVLLTVSSLSGSVVNVFATGTDDSVKVTTESKDGEDIVIENKSENDIVISDTNKTDEIVVENQDNVSETGQGSENIVIDDVKEICSSSVSLVKDEDEIVIEQETSVTGDVVPLYVKAENTSDQEMEFQLSFWTGVEDVETIKAEALKTMATSLMFEEFKETDSVSIDLKSGDKIVESKATLVEEQKEDTLTKCYISIKMPAKTVLDTEFHVSSDVAQTVTAVPCMADAYGKAVNVTWTEKKSDDEIAIESETTSDTEPEIVIEEENVEDSFASVYLGDNQVDTSSLNASDFASMRLVLLTEDKSVIPNEADVLSEYEDIYLLQFTSIQQTMNAYTYFKNLSLSVEPDMPVEAAGEKEDTEEIIVSKDALTVSETENPIDTLNNILSDTSDSEEITVSQDGNVIALIDTGVGESANVIDRVSVIEEPEASAQHGDAMLQAIVSQNPDAKILSIRAMNSNGFGTISSLVAAMEYAMNEQVDIINLSLYARTTLSTSVLKSEIQKAVDAGITVIGAAGNDGVDVVDYVPGSVEPAYIIGAAKEDGSRLETSNFGTTVDYNVVGKSTSEATALFTGYISKNGLDKVSEVLNQGMIFETGFGGSEEDTVEGNGEKPDVKPIEDTGEVFPVTIDVKGQAEIIFSNLDGSFVKKMSATDEVITEDVPMTGCQVEVLAPMYTKLDTVSVTDKEGKKVLDTPVPEIESDVVDGIRNIYFVLDAMQEMNICVETSVSENDVPRFDIVSESLYLESVLCDDNCLENHIRKGMEPTLNKVNVVAEKGTNIYDGLLAMSDEEGIQTAGLNGMPEVGQTYSGRATIIRGNYPNGANGSGASWSVSFGSGILQNMTIDGFYCTWHGAANEVAGTSGNYTARCTSVGNGTAMFTIEFKRDGWYTPTPDPSHPGWYFGYQTIGLTVKLDLPSGGLSIQKQSKDTTITNGNSNYSLKGAQYGIWKNANCSGNPVLTLTTDDRGYAKTSGDALEAGTYYVKETKASPGYALDPTIHRKVVVAGDPGIGNSVQSKEPPKTGEGELEKKSDNPAMTDGNNCYSLAGAVYGVWKNSSCSGTPWKRMTTDENGHAKVDKLPFGNYWVKEITPSKGFKLDTNVYPISITETKSKATIRSVEPAGNDPLVITINKIWNGPETPTVPSLAGTQFTVWYYDNLKKDVSGTPKKTWVLEVQKNHVNGLWSCSLRDEYLVKEKSDDFYRLPHSQKPVLPYGTYKIQETKHAPGYTLEGTWGNKDGSVSMSTTEPYITVVDKNTNGGINLWGGNEYTGHNKPHDTSIKIRKVDENGRPLAGAKFKLVDSKGKLVSTKTSGSDGYVTWDKLYPDIYTVTEIQAPNGKNLLAEDIEIHLPMRITEEDIKKYNIDRSKLSEWDKEEQCYYLFDVTYEISNHATFEAPMTGGFTDFMTFLPLVGGMAGFAGVGAVAMKRKKRK